MNEDDFDAATEALEEANNLALRIYAILAPSAPPIPAPVPRRVKLYGFQSDLKKRMAWDLACEATRHFHNDDPQHDPERILDEVNDHLNAQPDPCDAAKEASLMA